MTDTINVPRELLERIVRADPRLGTSSTHLIIAWEAIAELRAMLANPQPSQDMLMQSTSTDCRSDEGITVGLIDGIISIARVLRTRNLHGVAIEAAIADLRQDEDLRALLSQQPSPAQFTKPSLLADTNVGYAADAEAIGIHK